MSAPGVQALLDEWALRRLAERYAQAADRNDPELMVSLFTADAVIEGPGFRLAGHEQIRAIPGMLAERFRGTLHCVFNQTVTLAGDAAHGETYAMAHHRIESEPGRAATLDWAIRYQDRFVRTGGQWRFAQRTLLIEWTRTTPIDSPGA